MGTVSSIYISGLAGRPGPRGGAPFWPDTARVAGAALDPDRIRRPGGHHGGECAGTSWRFSVLGPGRTRGVLIPIPARRRDRAARHRLAGTALGGIRRCPTSG